jgi:protein TonB
VKLVEPEVKKNENLKRIEEEIVAIPKPKKMEKPTTSERLSENNSKAHANKSIVQKDKYKSTETLLPQKKSKLRAAVKKRKIKNKKSAKKILIAKKVAKKEELKEKEKNPMVLKGLFKQEGYLKKNETENQNSLFKGFDPEKFVKLDTRDKEDESYTETVSLDSQEFKYASYFSSIKKQIESVWSYPEQAVTRGLQGQLLLQFILDRSGKLVDISLVNSSEHEILDNAALDAVKTASPYNPFPEKIQKNKLKIIASFKYKPFYTSYK